eukprot:2976606-Amphidinium_carterae.1
MSTTSWRAKWRSAVPLPREELQSPDTSAASWWMDTIAWITDIMKKTKPRRVAKPKKDWLSTQTWQGMLYIYVADLRKYYSLRQRSLNNFLLKVCLTAWKTHPPEGAPVNDWFTHLVVYRSVLKLSQFLALHHCKRTIRKWQKADRNEWLSRQCDLLNNKWSVDKKEFFAVLRNFRPRTPKTAPPHVLPDGSLAATPSMHAEAQRQYWCKKLNASALDAEFSLTSEQVVIEGGISPEARAEAEGLVHLEQVRSLLCKLNPRKVSPDILPPSVMKELTPWIAEPLRAHMVDIMASGRCPQSWRGSQLIGIPKKASGDEVALRPISLLLTSAKLFGRIILDRIASLMLLPSHQMGVGPVTGVDFAQLTLGQVCCFTKHHNLNSGLLFVDMVGAFDAIHRELVFGMSEAQCAEIHEVEAQARASTDELPSGFKHELAARMYPLFKKHVEPLMHAPGVPKQIAKILTETNTNAWSQLPRVPEFLVGLQLNKLPPTLHGVKQGGVYSPLAYVLYQTAAEREFTRQLELEGLGQSLPSVSLWKQEGVYAATQQSIRSLLDGDVDPVEDEKIPFNLLAFFDDIAIARWSDSPEEVVKVIATITKIAIHVFKQYNLHLNLSQGKTEAAFRFAHRASQIHAGFATTARSFGREGMALQVSDTEVIQVVRHYKHLGGLFSPALDYGPEVSARKEAAKEGVANIAPLLRHADVWTHIKVRLVSTFSHSRLLVGLAGMGQLQPQQQRSLAHTYYWCLQRCFASVSDKPSLSHLQLVQRTRMPPFDVLLHIRRLTLFQRVVKSGATLPTIAIALASESSKSWCAILVLSLRAAYDNVHKLRNLPVPSACTLPVWAAAVSLLQGEWKAYLHEWRDSVILNAEMLQQEAQLVGLELGEAQTLECPHCGKSFGNAVALAAHQKAVHPETLHSVSQKVRGTECESCSAQFLDRRSLLVHLRNYAPCWQFYSVLPDLDKAELKMQTTMHSRRRPTERLAPPRRGPKKVVLGLPSTETLDPWIFDHSAHGDANADAR